MGEVFVGEEGGKKMEGKKITRGDRLTQAELVW